MRSNFLIICFPKMNQRKESSSTKKSLKPALDEKVMKIFYFGLKLVDSFKGQSEMKIAALIGHLGTLVNSLVEPIGVL